MTALRLKVQGLKAQNEGRVLVQLASQPISGGQPELAVSVPGSDWLAQVGLGAEVRVRIDTGTTFAEARAKVLARLTESEIHALIELVEIGSDKRPWQTGTAPALLAKLQALLP